MRKRIPICLASCCLLLSLPVHSAELFADDFDTNSSANWNTYASSADASATFAFDYSALGIGASPNSGGSTLGLRLAANIADASSADAITLTPKGQSFGGAYQLSFDLWMNTVGPFPFGGSGTTEFFTAGIGFDDSSPPSNGKPNGGWFAADGDGGSSRDYRAFKNATEQLIGDGGFFASSNDNTDPYYASFGGVDVSALGQGGSQTGTTKTGSLGFEWHEVVAVVDGVTVLFSIDGLPIVNLDPAVGVPFSLSGNLSIGYMDIFSSLAGAPEFAFGVIDNLVVSDLASVSEPSIAWLLGAGLGLLSWSRPGKRDSRHNG